MIPGIQLENGFSPISVYIEPRIDGGWQGAVVAQRVVYQGLVSGLDSTKIEYAAWYFQRLPENESWTCTSGEYFDEPQLALLEFGRKVRNAMGSTSYRGFIDHG